MNKRQHKKHKKKMELFYVNFASSYREVRELDKSYHEYMLWCKRADRCGHKFDFRIEDFEDDELF